MILCHIEENLSLFCIKISGYFVFSFIGRGRTVIFWAQGRQSSFRSISKGCARRGGKSDFAENSIAEKID
jgi:hypothetical protein